MENINTPGTIEFMQSKIKHVVYYMLENRSFDHVCGWLYENDKPAHIIGSQEPFNGTSLDYSNLSGPSIELTNGNWNNYYGTTVTFSQNDKNYLFAQNESKDRWFIAELTPEGVGTELASGNWNNYYGTAVLFTSAGVNYLFAQNESKDRWFISELTTDGVGPELASGNWKNYYGTAVAFSSVGKNYLFAQNESKDRWFIAELNPDGVGTELASGNWNNYYGTAVLFTSAGVNYLFAQNESKERWFISELTTDGVGPELASGNWNNYYGTAVASVYEGKNYLFAQNETKGRWFVSELTPDGVGPELASGKWNNYYGSAVVFSVGNISYMFAQTDSSNDRWFISYAGLGMPINVSKYNNGEPDSKLTCPTKGAKHNHSDVMNQLYSGSNDSYSNKDNPPMTGFVIDNNTIQAMETYTPSQLTVLNGIAKSYAISDEWFSSIPGPTDVNRAFSLTGSSYGRTTNFESNPEYSDWPNQAHPASIWKVLWDNQQYDWKVYYQDKWLDHCYTYQLFLSNQVSSDFESQKDQYIVHSPIKEGAKSGFMFDIENKSLPKFSYIEPAWVGNQVDDKSISPNSYHPSDDVGPGELALNDIYNAIQNSETYKENTLLIITFDEHGGQYDHVSPPYGARPFTESNPDTVNDPVTSDGFDFDLFGVRVPTILISPWIKEKTVFRSTTGVPYDSTSFLSTLLSWYGISPENWGLGQRVANAPTFEGVLTLDHPRKDKLNFIPPISEGSFSSKDITINGLHKDFTPRILFHLAQGKLNHDQVQKATEAILAKATNISELHTLLSEFQKKYE